MGRKSSMKKRRQEAKAYQSELVGLAEMQAESTEDYLARMTEVKNDESIHRQREADKLLDEVASSGTSDDVGFKAMLGEFKRLKKLVDDAENVTVDDLDKMKVEFTSLYCKVALRRFRELSAIVDDESAKADDRVKARKDLREIAAMVIGLTKTLEPATDAEKMRCDYVAAVINERTYHTAYLELHSQAKSRRAAAFMEKFKDPSGFITIDRIWAVGGFVQIKDRSGTLTTLTVKSAAMRAQSLQDMLPHSHPWHRTRWIKLIDEIVKVCREAQAQRLDRGNRGANLLREVYDGIGVDGNPTKVVIDDRFIANSKKLYPLMTEDEIIAVYSDTSQGFTMKQKEELMLAVYRERAFAKGMNPDLLQNVNLE